MIGLADVRAARERIAPYLDPTPLRHYPGLDELVGAEIHVKHDNFNPTGAFKVRGGINLVAQLTQAERAAGVSSASTGNHGQSIAYAARLFGVGAVIFVPEGANPVKLASMRELGAELVAFGRDFDDAREECERVSEYRGYRYVHSGNEPMLIAGVATSSLETLEALPDADVLIVPVGGGSGASGACIVAKALGGTQVWGAQSEQAPAAWRSWREGRLVEAPMATFAEGLATRTAFDLPQRIMREMLDDFVLVSDDEIRSATRLMIERTRTLVEPAGATALAAAIRYRDRLAGKRVICFASGGNVSPDQLRAILGG